MRLKIVREVPPVRLAYQPPASSTFLSEQTSHQQPANNTFLSEQISTSHQPNEQAAQVKLNFLGGFVIAWKVGMSVTFKKKLLNLCQKYDMELSHFGNAGE
jgi:hypothetical protein